MLVLQFFLLFLASIIGALPFGLVNLKVLEISYQQGKSEALKVAHGAGVVEVIFGFISIVIVLWFADFESQYPFIHYAIIYLPAMVGIVFFFLASNTQPKQKTLIQGFLKGIVLNIISLQVLLYWIFALAYLNTSFTFGYSVLAIFIMLLAIWLGKIGTLWVYAHYSKFILSKSAFLSQNINRIIGVILILSTVIQVFKSVLVN